MDSKSILITGGTGFIGSYLATELMKQGHFITIVTRNPAQYKEEEAKNQKFISWGRNLTAAMNHADVVINLAGENLFGKRWTQSVKETIYNSRIKATRALVNAIKNAESKPDLFISVSAVGIYGDSGDRILDESSPAGNDFLAGVCRDWETEAKKASALDVRVAIPRIGIVLEKNGGMLQKMRLPFLFFAGGPLGDGKQYIPWIHMNDLCRGLLYPIENEHISGPYNVCVPSPVSMNEFASVLGKVMNRPSFFRVPEFALSLALGEAAVPVLSSLRVQPKILQLSDFEFEFEDLGEALGDIL